MLCLGPEANTKPVKLIEQCENCAIYSRLSRAMRDLGSKGSSKFSFVVDDDDGDVVGVDSEGGKGGGRAASQNYPHFSRFVSNFHWPA